MAQTSVSSRAVAVVARADAVKSDLFAGHVETTDLLTSVVEHHGRLEHAAARGVDVSEGVTLLIQRLTSTDAAPAELQAVEPLHIFTGHAAWQAHLAQVAGGASRWKHSCARAVLAWLERLER
jgi:hypothetical protein